MHIMTTKLLFFVNGNMEPGLLCPTMGLLELQKIF